MKEDNTEFAKISADFSSFYENVTDFEEFSRFFFRYIMQRTAEILCFAEFGKTDCRICQFLTRKFPRSASC